MGRTQRIRKRGKSRIVSSTARYFENGAPIADWTVETVVPPKLWEYMVDTVGYIKNDLNPCYHERLLVNDEQVAMLAEATLPGPITFNHKLDYEPGGWVPSDLAGSIRLMDVPGLADWLDDFGARAEVHFVSAVNPSVFIINFLLELVDLITGRFDTLQKVLGKCTSAIKAFRAMYKKTGDYWLSWNFCIKPTIKDVEALLNSFKDANKRLKWLRARNHKSTKVHYREGWRTFSGTLEIPAVRPKPENPPPSGDPPVAVDIVFPVYFELEYEVRIRPAAFAYVRFDIDDVLLNDEFGVPIIQMILTGLYNPLDVLWEAIPWSWLIDWFLSERTRLLKRLAHVSPFPDAQLEASMYSVTTKLKGKLRLVKEEDDSRIDVSEVEYSLYHRQPGLPSATSPLRLPLQWYNASIILALIASKDAHRFRR